jgi:hypothetical protein
MRAALTYSCLVALLLLAGLGLKHSGISVLGCPGEGYDDDTYLAHCRTNTYGDYEEGALYYGLEPAELDAIRASDVVFLGDSRMQYAFSLSRTSGDWFARRHARPHLMGLAGQGVEAAERILLRHQVKAPLMVIDATQFFRPDAPWASSPAMYTVKRGWQGVHRNVCGAIPRLCRIYQAIYRSRSTGAWTVYSLPSARIPVAPRRKDTTDAGTIRSRAQLFLDRLGADRRCVVLTSIPNNEHFAPEDVAALAEELGVRAVIPALAGLDTLDDWHLDTDSATRWSAAFLDGLDAILVSCRPPPRPNSGA